MVQARRGRLLVFTGGKENTHCRLPVLAGERACLQVWWRCGPHGNACKRGYRSAASAGGRQV